RRARDAVRRLRPRPDPGHAGAGRARDLDDRRGDRPPVVVGGPLPGPPRGHRQRDPHPRTDGGEVDRTPVGRYCWIGERGEIPFDEGDPAAAEAGIARRTDLDHGWEGLTFSDEDTVLDVAAEWSLDPMTLDDRAAGRGLLGRVRTDAVR